MALSDLFPQWAGGTFGASAPDPVTGVFGAAGEEQPVSGFADPGLPDANVNIGSDSGSGFSSSNLVSALQSASKSPLGQQPANTPLAAAKITEVPAGRPRQAASLDALAKLLQQRQAQYTGLSGQPVAMPRTAGLLGF